MRQTTDMGMRRWRKTLALIATAGVVASLSASSGARAQTEDPQTGGRVVFAVQVEPSGGLNPWLVCCSFYSPDIARILMPHAYVMGPDFVYRPHVLSQEAEITTDPFTITYRIRDEAIWNDGTPVSARDFVFTWRTFTRPRNSVATRSGYDLIRDAEVIDPKTVRFVFRKPYGDYKDLFADVFPRHALRGKNFNRVWNRKIPISAGPFEWGEWVVGDHLTLVRNDDYWGEHVAYLDEVEFRFIYRQGRQIEALRDGEVDVIYPTADPLLAEVYSFPDVAVQSSPSMVWEHLDFSFRRRLLQKPFIRRALAFAIDREAIVEEVVHSIDPNVAVLDSLVMLTNEPGYEPHFDRYHYDPDQANQILDNHGCERGSDSIYSCDGRRLSFEYTTTQDNPIRKRLAEIIAEQLNSFGIEIEVRRRDAGIVFGPRYLLRARFDLFNFAWVGTMAPIADREIWGCDGSQNFNRYCNEDVRPLLTEADQELDPARRTQLVNLADSVLAGDIPALPLYQKPTFLAYSTAVHGLVDNPTHESPTWNIEDWWVEQAS